MVGDVHGDLLFASRMVEVARSHGIKQIVQLGDFGIWDHRPDGKAFLDKLNERSRISDVHWLFVAGNHENYDSLEDYESNRQHTPEDFVPIRSRIHWTRRVNTWNWEGWQWGAVGGAYSIDKEYRVPGNSWWHQEMLTWADVDKVADIGDKHRVNILISHDCPDWAKFNGRLKPDETSQQHRKMMTEVHKILLPQMWFHGHYHSWMDYRRGNTQVYGIECNDQAMFERLGRPPFNHVIFDTDGFQVISPYADRDLPSRWQNGTS